MPEQIVSASGVQSPLVVNADGSINTTGSIIITSGNVYIASGANVTLTYPGLIGEFNIGITGSNTETSGVLPANTRAIEFQNRAQIDLRFAFTQGKVAASTAPFFTLKANHTYFKEDLNLSSKVVYFANAVSGNVVELFTWS